MIVSSKNAILAISIYFLLVLTICESIQIEEDAHERSLKLSSKESELECDDDTEIVEKPKTKKGSDRVLSGNQTAEGIYPFFVQITKHYFFSNKQCLGALVHPKLVITTASCMDDWSEASVQPYIYDPKSRDTPQYATDVRDSCKSFKYRTKIKYESENRPWRSSDVVILRFTDEFPMNAVVNTIDIATQAPKLGSVLTFIGRGKKFPHEIKTVVTNCTTFATDSTSFCVTAQNKQYSRFCESDLGGPLVGDDHKLYGLLSYTVSCFQDAVMVDLVRMRPHVMKLISNCSNYQGELTLEDQRQVINFADLADK